MIRVAFAAGLAAAVLVPAASAKGPAAVSITGPGFSKTLRVGPEGFSRSTVGALTEQSGFLPAVLGTSEPMLRTRPAGPLGPRYRLVWSVPAGTIFHIRQEAYPYARGGAVTYTNPGQPIFGMATRGGWYRNPELRGRSSVLAFRRRRRGGTNWTLVAPVAAAGALLAAAVALRRRQRRQRSPSTSSTELPAGSRT
jgi:hypothetical protein